MEEKTPVSKASIWLGLVGIYLGWGTTYLANHYALEAFPAFIMNGTRNLAAGIIMYAFQRARGARPPTAKMWKSAFSVGLIMICCGSGINVWAQKIVPSGIASLLIGSIPFWMAVLDIIASRRAKTPGPGKMAIVGIVFGFAGIVLLIGPVNIMGTALMISPLGAAALMAGSVLWAAGSLKSRTAVFPASRVLGSGMQMIGGGLGLILAGTLMGEPWRFQAQDVSAASIAGFVYLIIIGSLFSFAIYTWLLGVAPTPLVSTYAYVNPIVAVILGAIVLDEIISLRLIVASAMILAAIAVVTLSSGMTRRGKAARAGESKPQPCGQSRPDSE
ncbi:MAG: EamA family transporter [Spirochaetales bacterium]|nr:EamA family transporter [Spirochaetales bacterium]